MGIPMTTLTDQQVRCALAERVMGWTHWRSRDAQDVFVSADVPFIVVGAMIDGGQWDPLTDWRAAGEILEAMQAKGWMYRIGCTEHKAVCGFSMFGGNRFACHERQASTPQRAICLAALAALEAA